MKETEIGAAMVEYLHDSGWEVYQEVYRYRGSPIADIVARQNKLIWIIELKTSMSFTLLEQIMHWKWQANYLSVCIPSVRRRGFQAFKFACDQLGCGIFLYNSKPRSLLSRIRCETRPTISRTIFNDWDRHLSEHQKTFCPAGSQSGRWSPFKQTIADLRRYIDSHPGCVMHDLVKEIDHHYQSDGTFKSMLAKHIKDGVIGGIKVERVGKTDHYSLESEL